MVLCATTYLVPLKRLPLPSTRVCVRNQRRPVINLPKKTMYNMSVGRVRVVPSSVCLFALEHAPFLSHEAVWEDPDDGSGSDYDEEDVGLQENDLDFESDWEEDRNGSLVVVNEMNNNSMAHEDDLVQEIEAILNPEERAILQANKAPNLEKISTAKWNPLHTLALSGQIHLLDNLLENGLDINFADKDGLTSLHVAVIGKKEAAISHLLRKGANPHVNDKHGPSPLHYAVQVGAIKYKVDVNVADNEGWTLLHLAMQSRNRDIAKVLLLNGADPSRRNKDGKSPEDLSMAHGKDFKAYELAKLLKLLPAY